MLTVPGGLAEFERELIRARTDEAGSELRPRRSVRPEAEAYATPTAALARREAREALVEIGRSYDVSH
jgi:hypothetical protein